MARRSRLNVNGGRWRIRQGWLSGSRAWFTIGEPVKAEGKPPAINDGSRRIEHLARIMEPRNQRPIGDAFEIEDKISGGLV